MDREEHNCADEPEKTKGDKEQECVFHCSSIPQVCKNCFFASCILSAMKHDSDPTRFEKIANFIGSIFPSVRTVADVGGGGGELAGLLALYFGYEVDVIDPEGKTSSLYTTRRRLFSPNMADNYDLIVGVYPDEATKDIVACATLKPVIIMPCCNYWDDSKIYTYGQLVDGIELALLQVSAKVERHILPITSSKNIILCSFAKSLFEKPLSL
jgi:hypothetical protein